MIVSGFYENNAMPGGGGFTEWELTGESIGLLAQNFLNAGHSVVINGYLDKGAWAHLERHVNLPYKILLLPQLSTVLEWDSGRNEDVKMGLEAVKEHHAHFSTDDFYRDFIILDSTHQTAEQTVVEILSILNFHKIR